MGVFAERKGKRPISEMSTRKQITLKDMAPRIALKRGKGRNQ